MEDTKLSQKKKPAHEVIIELLNEIAEMSASDTGSARYYTIQGEVTGIASVLSRMVIPEKARPKLIEEVEKLCVEMRNKKGFSPACGSLLKEALYKVKTL